MIEAMGLAAKKASYQLALLSTAEKNRVLLLIADKLAEQKSAILKANQQDLDIARAEGLSEAMLDRLLLTDDRLQSIIHDVRQVVQLKDPVGQVIDGATLDNGLRLYRYRVPLGVIGVIYEARPNVTIDIASLCLKTGNAVILRGGKETINTNKAIIDVMQKALLISKLPETAIQLIASPERHYVMELLKLDRYVDMLIPRGGERLHQLCKEHSTIPVIIGGVGVCHIFVDESADIEQALTIIINAKTQRPSVCNSVETLLIHQKLATKFLPVLAEHLAEHRVILHACQQCWPHLSHYANTVKLDKADLTREYLSLDLNVVLVDDLFDAVTHIRNYGTAHSDAILTRSMNNADNFVKLVDSAAVYVNASTRFTDGGQFGLGAEVAVSTQKLHARGPMGLDALTTYKWVGHGDNLIRQ